MLGLPDEAFFRVIRNYLGEVKTPYNKHDLIENLRRFLKSAEVADRIRALVSDQDAAVLSAVRLLGSPTEADLERVLGTEFGPVQERLINLQDRLLLLRDKKSGHYGLNPELAEELAGPSTRLELLFPSEPVVGSGGDGAAASVLEDQIFFSVLSFCGLSGKVLRTDGAPTRRFLAEVEERFPLLALGPEPEARLSLIPESATRLGLGSLDAGRISLSLQSLEEFAKLDGARRRMLIAAGMLSVEDDVPVEEAFVVVRAVVEHFPSDRSYPTASAARFLSTVSGMEVDDVTVLALLRIGLFREDGEGLALSPPPAGAAESPEPADEGGGHGLTPAGREKAAAGAAGAAAADVLVQANYEVLVSGSLYGQDALDLALICEPLRLDVSARYEITERSVMTAAALGVGDIPQRLERITQGRTPQNIQFSVEQWLDRRHGVCVYRGIILVIDEEYRYLVEHGDDVAELIRARPADGVYLVRDEDALAVLLDRAGLPESAAGILVSQRESTTGWDSEPAFRQLTGWRSRGAVRSGFASPEQPARRRVDSGQNGGELVESFRQSIDESELDAASREEALLRVEQKLILTPEQLRYSIGRSRNNEARGVDLVAKVRLFEQASRRGHEILEIVQRDAAGNPQRFLFRPIAVKRDGDKILAVGSKLPTGERHIVTISKVYLVRRMVGTLLGGDS